MIFDAQGNKEGHIPMKPGQMYIWQIDNTNPYRQQLNSPYTPFKVEWMCNTGTPYDYSEKKDKNTKQPKTPKYQSAYGTWDVVGVGATVTAQLSPNGPKTCVVKKKQPKKPEAPKSFNDFSNDGGQTWDNDSGPGWDEALDGSDFEEDESD